VSFQPASYMIDRTSQENAGSGSNTTIVDTSIEVPANVGSGAKVTLSANATHSPGQDKQTTVAPTEISIRTPGGSGFAGTEASADGSPGSEGPMGVPGPVPGVIAPAGGDVFRLPREVLKQLRSPTDCGNRDGICGEGSRFFDVLTGWDPRDLFDSMWAFDRQRSLNGWWVGFKKV